MFRSSTHPHRRRTSGRPLAIAAFLLVLGVAPASPLAAECVELEPNDIRISFQGGTGDADFAAYEPDVAYDPRLDTYLVVWSGDGSPGANDEFEIFGQLVARQGTLLGGAFQISSMGPAGDRDYDAVAPAVAFNASADEYLVVWEGDDDEPPLVDNEREIFGQRVTAAGALVGNAVRISDMGPDGLASWQAHAPAVAWNPDANEYLVAWAGEGGVDGMINGEFEVFVQRLAADGTEVGTNDIRISDAGGLGNGSYRVHTPAVVYNTADAEYLVVWRGEDDVDGMVDNEQEIFAQRLTADGTETGTNDIRISDMGGLGSTDYEASLSPSVSWSPIANEYLMVWAGTDDVAPVEGEYEVFAQRLAADGSELGANDMRLSDVGDDGSIGFQVEEVDVAWSPALGVYVVVWSGEDNVGGQINGETEIFLQLVGRDGAELSPNDARISDLGGVGNANYDARSPAIGSAAATGEALVVWRGDDDGLSNDEIEVFGQRVYPAGCPIFADGFESGDTSAWNGI